MYMKGFLFFIFCLEWYDVEEEAGVEERGIEDGNDRERKWLQRERVVSNSSNILP